MESTARQQDDRSAMSSWRVDSAESPPPLAHFLHAIDHAQMESMPTVNKDSVGVQLGSAHVLTVHILSILTVICSVKDKKIAY